MLRSDIGEGRVASSQIGVLERDHKRGYAEHDDGEQGIGEIIEEINAGVGGIRLDFSGFQCDLRCFSEIGFDLLGDFLLGNAGSVGRINRNRIAIFADKIIQIGCLIGVRNHPPSQFEVPVIQQAFGESRWNFDDISHPAEKKRILLRIFGIVDRNDRRDFAQIAP